MKYGDDVSEGEADAITYSGAWFFRNPTLRRIWWGWRKLFIATTTLPDILN